MSIGDDALSFLEQLRAFHLRGGRPRVRADPGELREDARARRITAYLDMVADLVEQQIEEVAAGAVSPRDCRGGSRRCDGESGPA
ncbi:MAG: hypothetical protein R3E97_24435 [Candidatus Eisenbacteria bacterium]